MSTPLFVIVQAACVFRVCVVLIALCISSNSIGASGEKLEVLWISSWNKDLPWQRELEEGLELLEEVHRENAIIYHEYMDAGRFKGREHRDNFFQYLQKKYSDTSLDFLVFESSPAAILYNEHPSSFNGIKTIVLNPDEETARLKGMPVTIPVYLELHKAIQAVLELAPDKPVHLLAGVQKAQQKRLLDVTGYIRELDPDRTLRVIDNGSLQNMQKEAASITDGIILYLLVFEDGEGVRYEPYQAIQRINEVSTVPVYSFWTSLLGSGVLGGYMLSGERVGLEIGKLLLDKSYQQISVPGNPISQDSFHGYYFDWRQMQRWGIDESELPDEHTVMFYEPSLLQQYYLEITTFFIVLGGAILMYRHRELKRFTTQMAKAHTKLQEANSELSLAQSRLKLQNRRLEELTIRDGLTGLYNRGYIDRVMQYECDKAERYGGALSLIVIDIDHFKAVNDRYGHKVGDKVLIKFSKVMVCNIRNTDVLARWGGEEFAILCPQLDHQQVIALAEKLRARLTSVEFETVAKISASFGVATFHKGMSREQLFENADAALYASKSNGRNCVSG